MIWSEAKEGKHPFYSDALERAVTQTETEVTDMTQQQAETLQTQLASLAVEVHAHAPTEQGRYAT